MVRLSPPPGWPAGYPYPYPRHLPMPLPRVHGLDLASPGARLGARLIDIGVVLALSVIVNGWFFYLLWRKFRPVFAAVQEQQRTGQLVTNVPEVTGWESLVLMIMLVGVAMWFAYEVPAVANNGQTLGKRLVGLKVMRLESPDPMGFARSWRRWNTMALPTFAWCCGIGLVFQFVDSLYVAIDRPLRQALHDKTALTVVVKVRHDEVAAPGSHRPAEGEPR
jgi:uncharacterized RDD family membrane protein YckC